MRAYVIPYSAKEILEATYKSTNRPIFDHKPVVNRIVVLVQKSLVFFDFESMSLLTICVIDSGRILVL